MDRLVYGGLLPQDHWQGSLDLQCEMSVLRQLVSMIVLTIDVIVLTLNVIVLPAIQEYNGQKKKKVN